MGSVLKFHFHSQVNEHVSLHWKLIWYILILFHNLISSHIMYMLSKLIHSIKVMFRKNKKNYMSNFQNPWLTFHCADWFIRILATAYYTPYKNWVVFHPRNTAYITRVKWSLLTAHISALVIRRAGFFVKPPWTTHTHLKNSTKPTNK